MQIWRRFVGIVEMIASFQLWYGSLDNADKENQTDPINARERDNTIYDACKLQNTNTQYIPDKKPQKAALSRIMESITFLHEHYQAMPSLQDITCDDVKTEYVCLVEYALWYFNTSEMDCLNLWFTLKQVALADTYCSLRYVWSHVHAQAHTQVSLRVQFIAHVKS